ncbi:MAG: hypothetical protein GX430_09030 [Treponema sp.]|nr:hypothetical protein [Treponema sp.]
MICDRCGAREATVFIRREGAGESSLCSECAREQGISAKDGRLQISLEDLFSPVREDPERPAKRTVCSACGIRLEEVRKTGRLGCPACFESFRGDLVPFLQRRGRRGPYRGSVPRRFAASGRSASGVEVIARGTGDQASAARQDLEGRLRNALDAEDYELAARLRDLIRSLGTEAS